MARVGGKLQRRLRALAVGASLLGLASPGVALEPSPSAASSRPSDATRRAQRALLERAKERYDAGGAAQTEEEARPHLVGALDALHLAYSLIPAPWLLFNMAQVQSRLGACQEAADLYHRFLASDPAPEAKATAERALQLLGSCADANRAPNEAGGLPPALVLPSEASALYPPAGEPARVAPPEQVAAAPAAPAADDGGIAPVLPWAFGSLAVMSGVAGAVYWAEANAAKDELDEIQVAGPKVAETQERGESAQDMSRIFGGLAVGFAVAAGVSYWFLRDGPDEEPVPPALQSWTVVPLKGGAGAAYSGAF
jgi:hypothetical protein